ncbi:MAG: polyprenyl synthetase family protein [Opitutales bacterium]
MEFTAQWQSYREQVERGIDELLPPAGARPTRLHEAMRYSLQAGGKRLRPVLVLAAADVFGAPAGVLPAGKSAALPAAVALECIHTYSLVHDDLPCMDNDDLRRGRPTAHKQFDEATALLAGDALLTYAFQLVARHYSGTPALCTALTATLGEAAGSEHLVGGQMEDLLAEKKADATATELDFIHLNKTAAMIEAALVAGGLCAAHATDSTGSPKTGPGPGATEAQLALLRDAGRHLGLAFQIIDDILDATADTATLGKTAGKDARAGKTTYVKLHGLDDARRYAATQTDAALAAFARLPGGAPFLTRLTAEMLGRKS